MTKKTFFISSMVIFICISLIVNGFLAFLIIKNSQAYRQLLAKAEVFNFRNMFERNVLLSDKIIDFDTRLSLESSVRGLGDSEILGQWQKFTNSETKESATAEAKKLLELLIKKTS